MGKSGADTASTISSDALSLAQSHFDAFAEAFLVPEVAERWQALFRGATPAKWRKIDPWLLWDENKRRGECHFLEVDVSVDRIASDRALCPEPSREAVVIALGHSEPGVLVKPFLALSGLDWPLDGLVSLEPGRRVFVANHDGDVLLCRR